LILSAVLALNGCLMDKHMAFTRGIVQYLKGHGYQQTDLIKNDPLARTDREKGWKSVLLIRLEEPTDQWEQDSEKISRVEYLAFKKVGRSYRVYLVQYKDTQSLTDCSARFNQRLVDLKTSICYTGGFSNYKGDKTYSQYGVIVFGKIEDRQGLLELLQLIKDYRQK
jgi:hypothetical protein